MNTHAHYTENMIKGQLNTNNVLDERILDVIGSTSREHFLPENYRGAAYVDRLISLGEDGALQEPLVCARMLALADIKAHDSVIVVCDATGYTTMLASKLADQVTCITPNKETYKRIKANLSTVEHDNISIAHGAISEQIKQLEANVIIVDGGTQIQLDALLNHLLDNGRLVTIAMNETRPGSLCGQGLLTLYTRNKDSFGKTTHGEAAAQLLPEFKKTLSFSL